MIIAGTPSATGMNTTTIKLHDEVGTKETTNRVHPINGEEGRESRPPRPSEM